MKHNKYFLMLAAGALILCLAVCGGAAAAHDLTPSVGATLGIENTSAGGWDIMLDGLPAGTARFAVLFEIFVGEGDFVPRLTLTEDTADCTLTLGSPVGGRVSVLIDGVLPSASAHPLRLLRVETAQDGAPAPRLYTVSDGLWLMEGDGRVSAYSLAVRSEASEGETCHETVRETQTATETATERENVPETEPAGGTGGDAGAPPASAVPPAQGGSASRLPDFLGAGEVVVGEEYFSVSLLFWGGEDTRAPATVCIGGGQGVSLSAETLAGTSAVIYTYRGLRRAGECRLYIDTEDGVAVLLFVGGVLAV